VALKQTAQKKLIPLELKAMAAAALVRCSDNMGLSILENMLEARRQSTRLTALTVIARLPVPGIKASVEKMSSSDMEMDSSAASETLEIIEREMDKHKRKNVPATQIVLGKK